VADAVDSAGIGIHHHHRGHHTTMQAIPRKLLLGLAPLAAAAALVPAGPAHAAPGDPAAVQASGEAGPTGTLAKNTPFVTGINIFAKLTPSGQLDPASTATHTLNFAGVQGSTTLSMTPTCLFAKGKLALMTGIGTSPANAGVIEVLRMVDNTSAPPGTAGETPDLFQFTFADASLGTNRCRPDDVLALFNTQRQPFSFPVRSGFIVVHEDEPKTLDAPPVLVGIRPDGPAPTGNAPQVAAPAPVASQPVTIPPAQTPIAQPLIQSTRTVATERSGKRVVCRTKRVRRYGHVRRIRVCRRVQS
jgi:hypothetical protein